MVKKKPDADRNDREQIDWGIKSWQFRARVFSRNRRLVMLILIFAPVYKQSKKLVMMPSDYVIGQKGEVTWRKGHVTWRGELWLDDYNNVC